MTKLLKIFGTAAVLVGGLWVGQGTGLVVWPADSFMLDQRRWAYIGAGLMLLGVVAIWRGKRRG